MPTDKKRLSTITDLIVRKSNLLIESGTNMNLMEQRIILTTMAQVLANDLDFETYSFTVPQLGRLFGLDSTSLHKEVRKVSDSLMEKFFRIPKENENDFRNQSVVDFIDYTNGVLSIKLADGLKNELLNLKKKGHFTSYEIEEIVRLRRTSSMRLYEILVRDRNLSRKTAHWNQKYTIDDLKDFLYIGNRYKDFRSFNQKVLKPSVDEINRNTDLNIDIKYIRSGRITSHIEFTMNDTIQSNNSIPEEASSFDENIKKEALENKLNDATDEEKERFDKIFENVKAEGQLSLFRGSSLMEESLRYFALTQWNETT